MESAPSAKPDVHTEISVTFIFQFTVCISNSLCMKVQKTRARLEYCMQMCMTISITCLITTTSIRGEGKSDSGACQELSPPSAYLPWCGTCLRLAYRNYCFSENEGLL
jgi:hypothetical protein